MFVATALAYPCVLAAVCIGAGLLVDRLSGNVLPAALLVTVGAATLIALSQLLTYASPLAPATPYALAGVALGGFLCARERARKLVAEVRTHAWLLLLPVLAYALALAPVLAAGRPSFSSFMALSDSAVHMMGADYLIHHGQDYSHLDLSNSYGQFIHAYYGSSYPSGADTLFGGSSLLLRLPLIWSFQPFCAFMLASASGPAWVLARRLPLPRPWAALAALTAVVPALVYAYELLGSIKEITALPMILTLGALAVLHRRWLLLSVRAAVPFALVIAAGFSALGVAFGAWALVGSAVVACAAVQRLRGRERERLPVLAALVLGGALTLLVAAWPTWGQVSGSLRVAQAIASTSNSGNLHVPLHPAQLLGVWLRGSYKLSPTGTALALTRVLIAVVIAGAVLGMVNALLTRSYAFAGWVACMVLAWFVVTESVTTWGNAKTLMLTSSAVVLLAWGGVAALRSLHWRWASRLAAPALALAIAAGVLASDALQYHVSNLAPTARYDELAQVGSRFADRGPALVTDFDEYALYELRKLDVGGPDFVYPPPALAALAGGYGDPVDLDRVPPAALASYPLIVTRRDPLSSRPPAAYRLLWQGTYYQVWGRRSGARPARVHVALGGSAAQQCVRIGALAGASATTSDSPGDQFVAAAAPAGVTRVSLGSATRPRRWGREREGFAMTHPGTLYTSFVVPRSGRWQLWLQGQFMPKIDIALDGHSLGGIGGELSGNSLVPGTVPPILVRLSAGRHTLAVTRGGVTLAPGDGGSAVLDAIFLVPDGAGEASLHSVPVTSWQALCGRRYKWVELLPA